MEDLNISDNFPGEFNGLFDNFLFLVFFLSLPQLQMTYGLNFPSVPLPYFYQANKLLSGSQHHHPQSQNPSIPSSPFSQPRDEDLDASDEQSSIAMSPREKRRGDAERRHCEEEVEVD